MEVARKLLTYQAYREMEFDEDDNFQYELLNGACLKKEKATILHQRTSGNIVFNLQKYLETGLLGELFFAPLDVVLDEHNAPQPDVIFVGNDKKLILNEDEQVIMGIPDIVVEVLSPGSVRRDRIDKKAIYEKAGIPEYWIVDPNYKNVEIYHLKENRYGLFGFVEETGVVKSSVLKDFELNLSEIF